MSLHTKQIRSLRLAIETLTETRRAKYSAGNVAYKQGIRPDVINGDGMEGTAFLFAVEDHKNYEIYTEAINQLEDLIEILTDEGNYRLVYQLPLLSNSDQEV